MAAGQAQPRGLRRAAGPPGGGDRGARARGSPLSRPVVAVVDATPEDRPRLAPLLHAVETRVSIGPADDGELIGRAAGADVLVTLYTYTQVTRDVLAALPDLRLVATRTAGYSHIDAASAAERGIAVAVVPDAATTAVAEYTIGAAIALGRGLFEARESTRRGGWEFTRFEGFELAAKTLGVVGLGSIGRRVAELGAAFGMRVLAWSRTSRAGEGVEQVELDELLARSDVVSVNVALTAETRRLLDDGRLGLMKPTAILVNSARGGVVDERAVRRRLAAGLLGGAVLDVLEQEPPERSDLEELADAPNLLVTPHIAWHTTETLERQFSELRQNVVAFLEGADRNLVPTQSVT